ncbi:hypothetical protein V8C86DRAFT_2722988 [Haematococcus lacustris]
MVPAAQEQQQQQPPLKVVEPVSSQEHGLASQASTGSSSSKRSNISKRSTMSIRFNKLMAAAVQRAHLLMSETPSLVTLISESGLVLVQNEASVSYYGNLEGSSVAALGVRLQAGCSPGLKPCPVEGLLRLLLKFAPPGLLEELLQTVVVDGQEWKGMLRVAPSLAYLEKIVFSNLGMTSSRPPRPDVEALVVSAASAGSRGDNTVSQEAQVAHQATQVSVAGSSLCQSPAINSQWQPSVVAVISTQPQPLSLATQAGSAAGSPSTSKPRPHLPASPTPLAAPRARRFPHACSSSRSIVAQDNQLHVERSNTPLPHAELGHITALGFAAQLGSELTLRSARSTVPASLDAAGGSTRRKRVTRCTTAHAAASFMSHAPAGGRSVAHKQLHPRDPPPQASQLPAAASQLICAPARSSSTPSTQLLTDGLVVALPEGTHDTQIDVGQGRPLPALQSAASGEQPQCQLSSGHMEEPLPSSLKGGSSPSLVVQAGCGSGALHSSSPKHPARVGLADAMQLIVEDDRESAGTGHEQGLEAVPGLVRTSMSTQLLAEALHLAKASAADDQPFYMTFQEQGPSCSSPRATASWSAFSPNPQPQPGPDPTISGLGLAPVHLLNPALQRHGSSTPISPSTSNLRRSLDSQRSPSSQRPSQHPSPTTGTPFTTCQPTIQLQASRPHSEACACSPPPAASYQAGEHWVAGVQSGGRTSTAASFSRAPSLTSSLGPFTSMSEHPRLLALLSQAGRAMDKDRGSSHRLATGLTRPNSSTAEQVPRTPSADGLQARSRLTLAAVQPAVQQASKADRAGGEAGPRGGQGPGARLALEPAGRQTQVFATPYQGQGNQALSADGPASIPVSGGSVGPGPESAHAAATQYDPCELHMPLGLPPTSHSKQETDAAEPYNHKEMLPRLNLSDPEWERSSAPAQTSMSTRPLAGLEPNCWHEIEVKPVVDPVTKERALLLVQRDVSERARLERNLAELTEAQLSMLSQIFPRHVIEALSMGAEIDVDTIARLARSHCDVSILFMDIAGFTAMSKDVPAEEVIIFLNILFSRFDMLVESHGVQKVDTIGDAYLVASGILVQDHQGFKSVNEDPDPEANARRLVAFAFDMMQSALAVRMPNGQLVRLRIGIHTGPCVSGLVGMGVPKWSVFGDTVNTAARLEQTCELCMIQVSEYTYSLLGGCFDGFKPSGGVHMKGKGLVQTHLWAPPDAWLQAAEGDQLLQCAAQGSVGAMQPVPPTRGLWQQAQSSARPLTILEDSEDGVSQASNSFSGARAVATAAAFDASTAQPPACTSSAELPSFQLPASSHSTRLAVLPGVLQPFSDTAWQSLRQRRASDLAGRGLANQACVGGNNEANTAQGFALNYSTHLPLVFTNLHLGQGFPATLPSPMPAVSTRGSKRSSQLETGSSDPLSVGQGFTLGSSNGWSSGRQQHSPAPRRNIPLKQVSTDQCQSDASVESTHKQVHRMWHLCLTAGRQQVKASMQSSSKGLVQSQKLKRSKTWMLQASPAASNTECNPTPHAESAGPAGVRDPAGATAGTGMGVHSLGRRTHVINPYQGQAMLDLPARSPRVGRSGTGRSLATSLTQASFLQPSITRLATPWLLNADPAARPSAQHCLQPPELSSSMPAVKQVTAEGPAKCGTDHPPAAATAPWHAQQPHSTATDVLGQAGQSYLGTPVTSQFNVEPPVIAWASAPRVSELASRSARPIPPHDPLSAAAAVLHAPCTSSNGESQQRVDGGKLRGLGDWEEHQQSTPAETLDITQTDVGFGATALPSGLPPVSKADYKTVKGGRHMPNQAAEACHLAGQQRSTVQSGPKRVHWMDAGQAMQTKGFVGAGSLDELSPSPSKGHLQKHSSTLLGGADVLQAATQQGGSPMRPESAQAAAWVLNQRGRCSLGSTNAIHPPRQMPMLRSASQMFTLQPPGPGKVPPDVGCPSVGLSEDERSDTNWQNVRQGQMAKERASGSTHDGSMQLQQDVFAASGSWLAPCLRRIATAHGISQSIEQTAQPRCLILGSASSHGMYQAESSSPSWEVAPK